MEELLFKKRRGGKVVAAGNSRGTAADKAGSFEASPEKAGPTTPSFELGSKQTF